MAPKGLISCRRAENIHGSLKSGQVHPFLPAFLPSRMALRQTVTRNTTPPLFFSLSFFFLPARGDDPLIRAKLSAIYIYPRIFSLRLKNPIKIPSPLILYTPSSRNEQSSSSGYFGIFLGKDYIYSIPREIQIGAFY